MKSHEAARIATGERIIARTREELRRPEVARALGIYAERTVAILDEMYVPHVVGGQVMIPQERRDTNSIALVLSPSSRRLTYPTEVTPTQRRIAEALQANEWRDVADGRLTEADVAYMNNKYTYDSAVKHRASTSTQSVRRQGAKALAITHEVSSYYDFHAGGEVWTVDIAGKPLVTIDPGELYQQNHFTKYSTLIHELQHVDDVLNQPVAVYLAEDDQQWSDDNSLRSELRAYAVEAAYTRVVCGNVYSYPVEKIRERYNGPLLTSTDPFRLVPGIARDLRRQDLQSIYR